MERFDFDDRLQQNDKNNYIVLDLKPHSRVVSFKIEENTLSRFDKYIRQLGFKNRSFVIKQLIYAFIEAVEKHLNRSRKNSGIDENKDAYLTIEGLVPGIVIKENKNNKE
ncbi:ribbon-helix-helix domain-containing protein [Staphylothermus hellenicus]|uniref:Putative transcriptional regulator, CopG family n=1 Tax=Staphylothermus hellenicus (strain DSM 12710 / JCM 10830 / BK20S6-10-b1 / P8) TaxID=591019 RepID=D7DC82_STAHD|nr:ribbon-helix-helix domain-containing protein [Staphylothermus hellenicus]ADI31779.1 putative transcriptional regulator, CopG family [Staphylothermus hellenicus DSM 12710]